MTHARMRMGIHALLSAPSASSTRLSAPFSHPATMRPGSYHPLSLEQRVLGYWLIKTTDILVDGKSLDLCGATGCQSVVDTGTSILVGPDNRVKPLLDVVNKTGEIAKDGAYLSRWTPPYPTKKMMCLGERPCFLLLVGHSCQKCPLLPRVVK